MTKCKISEDIKIKIDLIQKAIEEQLKTKTEFKIKWLNRKGLHIIGDDFFIAVYSVIDKRDPLLVKKCFKKKLRFLEFNLKNEKIEDLLTRLNKTDRIIEV